MRMTRADDDWSRDKTPRSNIKTSFKKNWRNLRMSVMQVTLSDYLFEKIINICFSILGYIFQPLLGSICYSAMLVIFIKLNIFCVYQFAFSFLFVFTEGVPDLWLSEWLFSQCSKIFLQGNIWQGVCRQDPDVGRWPDVVDCGVQQLHQPHHLWLVLLQRWLSIATWP